jgi:hypothetical protein
MVQKMGRGTGCGTEETIRIFKRIEHYPQKGHLFMCNQNQWQLKANFSLVDGNQQSLKCYLSMGMGIDGPKNGSLLVGIGSQ